MFQVFHWKQNFLDVEEFAIPTPDLIRQIDQVKVAAMVSVYTQK